MMDVFVCFTFVGLILINLDLIFCGFCYCVELRLLYLCWIVTLTCWYFVVFIVLWLISFKFVIVSFCCFWHEFARVFVVVRLFVVVILRHEFSLVFAWG